MGRVSGTDALIALITRDGKAVAYACGSKTISEWFSGTLNGSTLDLTSTSGDAHLHATLTHDAATGTLTLAKGQPLSFTASPATGDAGLYRAKQTINGKTYIGSWIVLADGEQRGKVTEGTNSVGSPHLDPKHPTVSVANVGKLAAQHLSGFVSQEIGL